MARAACTFRQRDVTAAIKATVAAGCKVARAEIHPTGKIVVIVAADAAPGDNGRDKNDWADVQ